MLKYLICLTALVALGQQANAAFHGCDDCEHVTGVFFHHLTSHAGKQWQTEILINDVCPMYPEEDVQGCETGVHTHWPAINGIIFQQDVIPKFCSMAIEQNCTEPSVSPQNIKDNPIRSCDECIDNIIVYGALYIYPEDTFGLEQFLKHEGYCMDPSVGLVGHQVTDCQHFLTGFISPAMIALYNTYTRSAQNICYFWYQECPSE